MTKDKSVRRKTKAARPKRAATKSKSAAYQVEQRSIDLVKPYPNNPRKNKKAVQRVADSITEYGWRQPIVVDPRGVIVAGHTRYEAALVLGLSAVPIHVAHGLTRAQIRAYRIADNATADYSEFDDQKLGVELKALAEANFDLGKTQLTDKAVESLIAEVAGAMPIEGEVEFSEELLESQNYIVLTFNNDIDWLAAKTQFGLRSVHSKRSNGKPWSKGIGRVVDGVAAMRLMSGKKAKKSK